MLSLAVLRPEPGPVATVDTDPPSRQKGRPTSTNPELSKDNLRSGHGPQMGAGHGDRPADIGD
jgi:hypothetical protein